MPIAYCCRPLLPFEGPSVKLPATRSAESRQGTREGVLFEVNSKLAQRRADPPVAQDVERASLNKIPRRGVEQRECHVRRITSECRGGKEER